METFVPISKLDLSLRKQKMYEEFSKVVNWGRCNPAKFAEIMYGAKLMDYQLYAFEESWTKSNVAWLMCRGAGKTVVVALYLMTRLVLIPDYKVYISTTKQEQAIEAFMKIEDIAMNRLPSFKGLTDIFRHELDCGKNGAGGFSHNPAGYQFKLFNGSGIKTLSSNEAGSRGKRGSVWYDEAGWIRQGIFNVVDKYTTIDTDFVTDSTNSHYERPPQLPLQILHTSSAGSAAMPFYDRYRKYAKHMIAGDPNFFVCNFDVDVVLNHSSLDGRHIKSHLAADQIEKDIRDNPESADMEFYNHFKHGAGNAAVVSEDCLIRNSHTSLPVFFNDTGKRKFIFCYDPARNFDNSILSVWEVRYESNGYNLYCVNVISMVNTETEKKTPLNYVDQIRIIRDAMLAYNGAGAADYENIQFYIDAGSGGAPRSGIADQLLFPWTDKFGVEHRGIIDPKDPQYQTDRRKHPNNAKIVHLLEPRTYKAKIYGALEELANLNLIHFTMYDGHAEDIMLDDGKGNYRQHKLTSQEREALIQIELAKNEVSYICRTETPTTRTVTYELVKERQNKMHDDRAYTVAMAAYALWELRNKDLRSHKTTTDSILFKARPPKYDFERMKAYG